MDFEAEGMLEDLSPAQRAARLELLERLAAEGFSPQQLRDAVAENRLALLEVDRVLGGEYSAADIQELTGVPIELMLRIRQALGRSALGADERAFSAADVDAARSTKLFLDAGFDERQIIEISRVLGEGMARLAAAVTASFLDTFLAAGDSEDEVAERFAELTAQLTPALTPPLVAAFRGHLSDSVSRGILGREELESGDVPGSQDLAVCFADLVGFTRLGGEIELRELGSVAGRLAALATSVAHGPVRLIKTIGDAAMFVSPDAGPLVRAALALVQTAEEAELPSLRAGIAVGPALLRAGDYYGHSVNIASRVTGVARPGSVLCTEEVRDAAGDGGLLWSAAGRHRLKGVKAPMPLYRARPAEPDGGGEIAPPPPADAWAARRPRAGRSRRRAES
jgi:adenylate cyclase